MQSLRLSEYFHVAFQMQAVKKAERENSDQVMNSIDNLIGFFELKGFKHTMAHVRPLKDTGSRLKKYSNSGVISPKDGVPDFIAAELLKAMTPIISAASSEASDMVMAQLNRGAASERLRNFGGTTLTADQAALKEETIRCLEIEAYRAAMVMGWNLVFDCVRVWMMEPSRLAKFNGELTKKERKKGVRYEPIGDYSDFFVLGERDVLNWSLQSGLFSEKVHRALIERLERRNDHAHANFKHPDSTQALGYIHELLTTIEDTPFSLT